MSEDPHGPNRPGAWGSDIIADALREQGIPYACLVPGASFRGLHDSIVNRLGNRDPRLLLCLHEEHAVSIAHGWALVTGEPLAALLHTNVGLMHAAMAVFNAWCDRMPALLIGASGPFDATKRRPWIDWIHSAADLGAQVRDHTKWDDAPASPAAAVDAIRRGAMIARTSPAGPVYINLDIAMQEAWIEPVPAFPEAALFRAPAPPAPAPADVEEALRLISRAQAPLMLLGRVSRDPAAWDERVRLAERLGLRVLSLYNVACGFPRRHPLHAGVTRLTLDESARALIAGSDFILSLDWTDLGGTLAQVWEGADPLPPVISVSDDFHLHRGYGKEHHRIAPASLRIPTPPGPFVSALLARTRDLEPTSPAAPVAPWSHHPPASGPITLKDIAFHLLALTEGSAVTLVSRPIGWPHGAIRVEHPLDFLGSKGGEGLGAGPGMLVGAALAIRDRHPGRLAISVLGDGDFLMGASALWTAAAERIPLLAIVANNRSYYNDAVHQERVARRRGRPVERSRIGLAIDDPAPDLAGHARSLGLEAAAVADLRDLPAALAEAVARLRAGASYLLDVATVAAQQH